MSAPAAAPSVRKAFQEATVAHAVSCLLDPKGSRRFLVADEVGLGKTLVAQGILERLADGTRPLTVFYVCSSLTIANQNRERLLELLPPSERTSACVQVDRPTLLPWTDPPGGTRFTLFTLSSGMLPLHGAARGRVDERAALWCLLREGLRECDPELRRIEVHLQRVQDATWAREVAPRLDGAMLVRVRQLAPAFINDVRTWLKVQPGATDRLVAIALLRRLDDAALKTIQSLRRLLSRVGLKKLRPDLVILDEFQRFFEFVAPARPAAAPADPAGGRNEGHQPDAQDEDAQGLLRLLLEARAEELAPAVLLLSATPYRPPAGGADPSGLGHYEQFFLLLEFLFGPRAGAEVPALRSLFKQFGDSLRTAPPGDPDTLRLRGRIQEKLSRVIARTERAPLLGAAADAPPPERRCAPLQPADVHTFRVLWDSAAPPDRGAVPAYWGSIPYPLQMMDQSYVLRRRASPPPLDADTHPSILTAARVRRYSTVEPPHPRMRALLSMGLDPLWSLPWMPPSVPWWPLGSPFREAADAVAGGASKLLLFSRFRAVPRAVAALVTYEAERRAFGGDGDAPRAYDYFSRSRGSSEHPPAPDLDPLPSPSFNWQVRARESGDSQLDHALMSLFVPAPALAGLGDPLRLPGFAGATLGRSEALEIARGKMRDALAGTSPPLARFVDGRRTGQLWRALLALERSRPETWPSFRQALSRWTGSARSDAARAVGNAWQREAAAPAAATANVTLSSDDLDELAELALTGPGNVLLRAVGRVFGDVADLPGRLQRCSAISLGALRTYLDEPEFHMVLARRDRQQPNHPAAVRRAVWHGNLEAVLDEYLAVHAGLCSLVVDPGREHQALAALENALSIRVSTVRAQTVDGQGTFGLRCHAAMPFGLAPDRDERSDGERVEARPDSLRQAFNSPFRPFVLATTSIGQEGLDFHVYCDRLVHWDLPSSPVDLEQRDGRISRHGGLAVRKALARRFLQQGGRLPVDRSPWLALATSVEESCEGMSPWWGTDGASIHRYLFLPPMTRQQAELDRLLRDLSHYRLAIGQADPDQLLRNLRSRVDAAGTPEERERLRAWLREAHIDLAPVRRGSVDR